MGCKTPTLTFICDNLKNMLRRPFTGCIWVMPQSLLCYGFSFVLWWPFMVNIWVFLLILAWYSHTEEQIILWLIYIYVNMSPIGMQKFYLHPFFKGHWLTFKHCNVSLFTPQPLRAVGVLFSPMVSGWAGGGKKFVRAVSQKPRHPRGTF